LFFAQNTFALAKALKRYFSLLHVISRMNPEGPLFDEKTLIKVNMGFGKVLTVETFREILKINSLGS
jgi:hypothetical protein